jgi:monoamine oxidase
MVSKSGVGSIKQIRIFSAFRWLREWDSQPEGEKMNQALQNLANIHGDVVYREFVSGVSKSWSQDPYIAGDFIIIKPGQEPELGPYLSSPEGRVHFAGEHTSTTRAWIDGAIESGIRVASEVNQARD